MRKQLKTSRLEKKYLPNGKLNPRRSTGAVLLYKNNENINVKLETFHNKPVEVLTLTLCITINPSFSIDYTKWEWDNLWRKVKTKLRDSFYDSVCPDYHIMNVQYPSGSFDVLKRPNMKVLITKRDKMFIPIVVTFNNNEGVDWKINYIDKINEFVSKSILIIEDINT